MSVYKDSGLGRWFDKGGEGGTTKGGWDRYNTKGEKIGKCGDAKESEGKPKCLSAEKAKKMTKKEQNLFGIDKLNIARSEVPAITHIDYSARVQTVHEDTNSKFHSLISKFYEKTGCPILINTSFNVRGEPIVCSPIDAFKCFMGTGLDVLAIGNIVLYKKEQDSVLSGDYRKSYELD